MPLKPSTFIPMLKPGRPRIDGKTFNVIFPTNLLSRIEEYRNWVKNKTGIYPPFSAAVRGLIDRSLNDLGITEENNENEEETNKDNLGD